MRYYPIFLNLGGAKIFIAGAGPVGLRKLESLLPCGAAEILLCDPARGLGDFSFADKALILSPGVVYEQRAASLDDLEGRALVFACTGDRAVNAALAGRCRELGLPCNVADSLDESAFIVPAHFTEGGLSVALSSAGGSPALSRRIRQDLQAWLAGRYTALALLLARLRPLVLGLGKGTEWNTELFRKLVNSGLNECLGADLLPEQRLEKAQDLLKELLPAELHYAIGELLHDLP